MGISAALLLAASAPMLAAAGALAPTAPTGVRATANVTVTILRPALIRLGDEADGPIARDAGEHRIHRQRQKRGARVLVEFN
jgi:hypothetical protein